ncbi:MAG: hypothetical protein PGN09_14055 [Sphingomonas fennica]
MRIVTPARSIPPLLALAALAACDRGTPADPPPAAPPAARPVATAPHPGDYTLYRAVATDLAARGRLGLADHLTESWEGGATAPRPIFDAAQCVPLDILPEERLGAREAALQQAAARAARLEHELQRAGYDRAVYAAPLDAFERAAAAPGADLDALADAFARAAEPRRRARQPDRPPIVYEGGCGAGESDVPFAISPADGEARLIRVFSFAVCAKRRTDPWDATRCPGWIGVRDGGRLPLSGTYAVQVRWPDGRGWRGDVTAQGFDETEDPAPIRLTAPPR